MFWVLATLVCMMREISRRKKRRMWNISCFIFAYYFLILFSSCCWFSFSLSSFCFCFFSLLLFYFTYWWSPLQYCVFDVSEDFDDIMLMDYGWWFWLRFKNLFFLVFKVLYCILFFFAFKIFTICARGGKTSVQSVDCCVFGMGCLIFFFRLWEMYQ